MQPPRLTFACELAPARLTPLFADPAVIADLQALGAYVALALADLSDERAAVVQQLNRAGVPVVASPLLPLEEGYYFTPDNTTRAAARYDEWRGGDAPPGLGWGGGGLGL